MGLGCHPPLELVVGAGIAWPDLRAVEIFASLLNGEEDLAGFVSQFRSLLPEAIIQVHVFSGLLGIIL
jgi:hypothetical protein